MSSNQFRDHCASERSNIINQRLYARNVPSQVLQPYLSVAPAQTKFSVLPVVDPRKIIRTPMEQMPTYDPQQIFNPGNATAPWSGYAANVNKESELKNQIYALQKCSQATYVPSPNSDLYQYKFQSTQEQQPFPDLFKEEMWQPFNPNQKDLGSGLFNNCTRQQLKSLTDTN